MRPPPALLGLLLVVLAAGWALRVPPPLESPWGEPLAEVDVRRLGPGRRVLAEQRRRARRLRRRRDGRWSADRREGARRQRRQSEQEEARRGGARHAASAAAAPRHYRSGPPARIGRIAQASTARYTSSKRLF